MIYLLNSDERPIYLREHGRRQAWARGGHLPPWKCANGYLQPQSRISSTQNAPKLAFFSSKIEKFSGEGAQPPPQTPLPFQFQMRSKRHPNSPVSTYHSVASKPVSIQFNFKNSTQNAPKLAFSAQKIEKIFLGGGISTPIPSRGQLYRSSIVVVSHTVCVITASAARAPIVAANSTSAA